MNIAAVPRSWIPACAGMTIHQFPEKTEIRQAGFLLSRG
ncbi:hypothetical protein M785_03090 [Neisseria gonorrhoeae MU_NG20]|nr:hypothetical protein M785_03090 [Neisseria gonorrhoeae MU_NG20]